MKRLVHLREDYNNIKIPDDLNIFVEQSCKKAKHLEKIHYYHKLGWASLVILLIVLIIASHLSRIRF